MKKSLFMLVVVLALSSTARSQKGCGDCPAGRMEIETFRENRAAEVAAHNEWPKRPALRQWSGPERFGRLKAEFAINNDTDKRIKQVTWLITLVHLKTKALIASYTVVVHTRIDPHKEGMLKSKLSVPLRSFYGNQVVSANAPAKPGQELPDVVQAEQFNEIKEIRYADGSSVKP